MALQELKKKKVLSSLSRAPAQDELSDTLQYDDIAASDEALGATEDEVVDNSAMDLVGEASGQPKKPSGSDPRMAETIGRMVAGATPTLFGMLFGPQQAERGIAATQKFNAAGKATKLLPVIGPDGEIIYETPDAAIGGRVPQKPVKTSTPALLKPEYQKYYDTETKKAVFASYDPNTKQVTQTGTDQVLNDKIASGQMIPAVETTDYDKVKSVTGQEVTLPREKFGTPLSQKPLITEQGLGSKAGISEYHVKEADNQILKLNTDLRPFTDNNVTIDSALANLNASRSESIAQAAGVFQAAKAISREKMTDADYNNITAEASLFAQLSGKLEQETSNKVRANLINQMKNALNRVKAVNNKYVSTIGEERRRNFAGNDPSLKRFWDEKVAPMKKPKDLLNIDSLDIDQLRKLKAELESSKKKK